MSRQSAADGSASVSVVVESCQADLSSGKDPPLIENSLLSLKTRRLTEIRNIRVLNTHSTEHAQDKKEKTSG